MRGFTPRVKELLKAAGCRYLRPANGDHEWWESPLSGKRFVVDGNIKSRHTANEVLKQAGLQKTF